MHFSISFSHCSGRQVSAVGAALIAFISALFFVGAVVAATPNLADDFNDNQRSASLWNLGGFDKSSTAYSMQVAVSEQNGQLRITPRAGTSGSNYNGYMSTDAWSLSDARASVEVVQTTSAGAETIFAIGTDSSNWFRFRMSSNTLSFQSCVAMRAAPTAETCLPEQ